MASSNEPHIMPPLSQSTNSPRLRVHHLLVWITVTAAWLSVSGVSNVKSVPAWLTLASLLPTLGWTAAITCCVFGFWWRRRGVPFPQAPGQWICILIGVGILLSFAYRIIWALFRNLVAPSTYSHSIELWGWQISAVTYIVMELWLAKRFASERRWMWFFLLGAILLAVHLLSGRIIGVVYTAISPLGAVGFQLGRIVQFLTDAYQVLPALLLCWACWADYRDQIARHWSHWCGIVAWLFGLPIAIVVACMNMGWITSPWN
jgi:hypothetical protein